MQTRLLIFVAAIMALCVTADADIILLSNTVNDGSFEESYSTPTGTGYLKFNNDHNPPWDLTNQQGAAWPTGSSSGDRGVMESPNPMLWSDRTGSVNPDTARGTGIYCDALQSTTLYVYNRSFYGTGGYGTTIPAQEGDVLNFSFDFNRHNSISGDANENSVLTVRIHLDGVKSFAFHAGEADMTGGAGGWVTRSDSYTMTASDAAVFNADNALFGVAMNTAGGTAAIYADNFTLTVPEPTTATLGLLGLALGGFVIRRRRMK